MKKSLTREQIASQLFAFTDDGAKFRNKWRSLIGPAIWLVLSGFTMILTVFSAQGRTDKLIIIAMSLVKYVPLMMVVYSLSRKMTAKYLNDVYELEEDDDLASDFLEHVAFNQIQYTTVYNKDLGKVVTKPILSPLITIKDGQITEKDEASPLILIGGPGFIQVNLDSIALLEKVTGEPEVIYPRKDAWRLGSFERIREIGESDDAGEREYAIINLRDQIISGIVVKSRTKDGIPIEARDIKAMLSILRRQNSNHADAQNEAYLFDERAVQALVYNQTTITPELPAIAGFEFPWNTTVVPLIISEIERVITSHTLNEILASTGQKDMDNISVTEQNIEQMRLEITGKHSAQPGEKKGASTLKSESRTKITERFFQKPFTDKAAAMGVQIDWIDIGTWKPSPNAILEKQKESWSLAREIIKKQTLIEQSRKRRETGEIINLIDNVSVYFYDKISEPDSGGREMEQRRRLEDLAALKPEVASQPNFQAQMERFGTGKKGGPNNIALEMLKAFRKELLAGKALIEEKETKAAEEKKLDLEKIEKTLESINSFFPRTPKKPA
jgi:hypothetical protein